jgi:hypothetical protein
MRNFTEKFRGKLQAGFWKAARAKTTSAFERAMLELKGEESEVERQLLYRQDITKWTASSLANGLAVMLVTLPKVSTKYSKLNAR